MATDIIHFSLDPNEESDIDSEYDESEESSQEGYEGCHKSYGEMGREGETPCDEDDGGGNWVNDQSSSPGLANILSSYDCVVSIPGGGT